MSAALLNDLKMLAAHQQEALKITQKSIKQIEGEATRKSKGLDEKTKADLHAKRRRTALKNA